MEPLLRAISLSKNFGSLLAVQGVSFDVYPGEVVGLAGRSGSGKSVLVMLLSGLYIPSAGDLYLDNRRLEWPFRARQLGIEVIHQRPELADDLDITGNVFLGRELGWPVDRSWLRIPSRRSMDQMARKIFARLDIHFDSLHERVANLSSEERQLIAIARTLVRPAKLVIVDEPTLLLSYPYQQKMLSLIQEWQQQNVAVIFSSNNLEHIFAVTDRIITLREGCKVADLRTDQTDREEIVSALVGTPEYRAATIWGFDSYQIAREQAEKLRHYQMLLEKDLAAQDTFDQQLLDQLAQQVKALDQANQALQEAHRRLMSEREDERKHLARELHDQVIQDLLSLNYQLEEIETDRAQTERGKTELTHVRQGVRELVEDLRQICGNLRPPTIDSLGLGAALKSFTREWAERSGIQITLELDENLGRLPEALELSIFRIIQESLNNVSKHTLASEVSVSLQHTSPRTLMISISDNGIGLPENFELNSLSAQGHYGLVGISERVVLLGGRLRLQNQASGGLRLQVEIPHPRSVVDNNHPAGSVITSSRSCHSPNSK
jgi:signal transduction histidine kinase